MKKDNPKPKAKGFGFGDAMFAMKDLQSEYSAFNDNPPSQPIAPIKKNPPSNLPKKIPQVAKSPQIKSITQKTQDTNLNKVEFKINPGKEYTTNLKFHPLNDIPLEKNVFELTTEKDRSKWEYNVFCDGLPADQIVASPCTSLAFNTEDIKQGQLGNCYFICALASLAKFDQVLKQRIPEWKRYGSKDKTFKINLFESGKNIEILVQNLFPNIYCKPTGNDISPMILEKAYAQVYGNYDVINLGHASDALRDLTGAPTFYVDLKNPKQTAEQLHGIFKNKYPIVIASKQKVINNSISAKHSYNVLDWKSTPNGYLLKLRDPRGWTKAEFDVPKEVENNFENGIFWVASKDVEPNFEVISYCKLHQDYFYYFKAFSAKELTQKMGGVIANVNHHTQATFSIHQKHKKFFDDKFSYDIIRILIAEVDCMKDELKIVKTLHTNFNAQQVCTIQAQLTPGKYLILGQIGPKTTAAKLYPSQLFTISCYSSAKTIEFELLSGAIDLKPFLINYISNHRQEFKESSTEQGLRRYQGPLLGYICLYYENQGNKQIIEQIEYTAQNIEITDKKVQLGPNDTKLLMHPIGSANNCSHSCSLKIKTYYK